MTIQTINPATHELLQEYREHSDSELQGRLQQSANAFQQWRRTDWTERSKRMHRVAQELRQRQQEFATLITREMGKPIKQARAEVAKCALVCDHYAERSSSYLEPIAVQTEAARSIVRFDPLGAVLAVMPWNFPFWQVFRFAVPALMAGNVGILKHASNVSGSALAIESVFKAAGFPDGSMSTLLLEASRVAGVIADPRVAAVTLTGSEGAGKSVAAAAGQHLKKTVLELGGSDPFIVLSDANVLTAARQAAQARMINTGQSCIAAKRFIVVESLADTFEQALSDHLSQMVIGDPLDEATQVGPLAREDLLGDLAKQVSRSIEAGAQLMLGGKRLERQGNYFAPTVLRHVKPGMAAFDEETFGPVAAVIRARDDEEAIELGNRSRFGLGASLWTADLDRGQRLAAQVEAGCVFINATVMSDPRLPFGGIKASGYGRELAAFGIREFMNIKSVWCEEVTSQPAPVVE